MAAQVSIAFMNHDGSGFSDRTSVNAETSVGEFFAAKYPGKDAANYRILVNGQQTTRGYQLRDNDTLSITPNKVAGAVS